MDSNYCIRYDHWKTVRGRKEQKDKEFEQALENMKSKEKTRENSYIKFLKTENGKKRTQFHNLSEKRQAVKKDNNRRQRDIDDSSYDMYV